MNKIKYPLVDLPSLYKTIKKETDKKLIEVAASGHYIKGSYLEEFENKFAKYIGTKYAAGVASGTDALKLSLAALPLSKGDEVIIPANTFVATAYAVVATGATPVIVDIEPNTLSIDPTKIKKAITRKTKAIIPVHLFGFTAKMDEINRIAKKHKLFVLEDAAQAHGAKFKNKLAGNLGTIAAFSFYPGKNLGAFGDGGAITTNSKEIYEHIVKLREYGGSKYYYSEIGTNSRLDAMQAAILTLKLKHLEKWNAKRRELAQNYTQLIKKSLPQIKIIVPPDNTTPVYHLYVIAVQKRDKLVEYLKKFGIETGIHYPVPVHLQESLKFLGYKNGDFPVSEAAAGEILSLPMHPTLTKKDQEFIIGKIKEYYAKN